MLLAIRPEKLELLNANVIGHVEDFSASAFAKRYFLFHFVMPLLPTSWVAGLSSSSSSRILHFLDGADYKFRIRKRLAKSSRRRQ